MRNIEDVQRRQRRTLLVAAVLICTVALARCAAGQTPTVVADTTHEVTHTVKTGDTLWDLARTYLKNPFRWPDIFRRNTDVVKNPHWIYPGEVIRIPVTELRPDVLTRVGDGSVVARVRTTSRPLTVFSNLPGATGRSTTSGMATAAKYRAPGVRAGEIESAPYLDRSGGPRDAGEITAPFDRPGIRTSAENARFQLNDQLYVSLPKGITARLGDRYLSYVLGDDIDGAGQLVIPTAILRIEGITPGEPPMARVVRQFGEVRLGQRFVIADPVLAVTRTPWQMREGVTGKVLLVHMNPVLPSVQHYVLLSPSSRNGIAVGDEFTLIDDTMGREDATPAPAVSAAIAQVVKVTPFGSTAIIISQLQPAIKEGMPVRQTATMR